MELNGLAEEKADLMHRCRPLWAPAVVCVGPAWYCVGLTQVWATLQHFCGLLIVAYYRQDLWCRPLWASHRCGLLWTRVVV